MRDCFRLKNSVNCITLLMILRTQQNGTIVNKLKLLIITVGLCHQRQCNLRTGNLHEKSGVTGRRLTMRATLSVVDAVYQPCQMVNGVVDAQF